MGKKYRFSVGYDPRYFVVDVASGSQETLFVAKPRWNGLRHFNVNGVIWDDCVYISASDSPPWHGAPMLKTEEDVREWEATQRAWDVAHRVLLNGMVGTRSQEVGLESSGDHPKMHNARTIIWDFKKGDQYYRIQVDCPTKKWRVWGPRMLAIVNSLRPVD